MNNNLLKAVVELVEASFERDFLAEPELASLHDWVRSLWAKQEAEASWQDAP